MAHLYTVVCRPRYVRPAEQNPRTRRPGFCVAVLCEPPRAAPLAQLLACTPAAAGAFRGRTPASTNVLYPHRLAAAVC